MPNGQQTTNKLWTPANVVTCVRIGFVPVFMAVVISPWPQWVPFWQEASLWQPWVAALLFALISCTDAVDGYLARSRNEVTDFGKFVDPLADKILVGAALLALCELQVLPSWVALIIICREFIISGLRMLAATKGLVIAASWYGKFKTVTTIFAILMFIVKDSAWIASFGPEAVFGFGIASWAMMVVALLLTIWSMVDYFMKSASIFGFGITASEEELELDAEIRILAADVIKRATDADIHLSTAESCTGGLIGAALTSVPGSSAIVEGGIISYSNEVKMSALGVSSADLAAHGAVSEPVVLQMAAGSRAALGTQLAVSVSGIAGPGGGTTDKPVGTVWFGISSPKGQRAELVRFEGDRSTVRFATAKHALELMLEELD